MQKDSRLGCKVSRLIWSQQGVLGTGILVGVIRIGTWSESVEVRDVVSQATKGGDISGLEKAKSIASGL